MTRDLFSFGNVTQHPGDNSPPAPRRVQPSGFDPRKADVTARRDGDREPLALMTGAERNGYCDFLRRLAGRRQGNVARHLRQAASELSGRFM